MCIKLLRKSHNHFPDECDDCWKLFQEGEKKGRVYENEKEQKRMIYSACNAAMKEVEQAHNCQIPFKDSISKRVAGRLFAMEKAKKDAI